MNYEGKGTTEDIINYLKENFKEIPSEIIRGVSRAYAEEPYCLCTKDLPDRGDPLGKDDKDQPEDIEDALLERLIDVPNFLPVHFLEEGSVIQRAVARVSTGTSFGTGFMVSPTLFMTNNHVISSEAEAQNTKIQFNYQEDYLGNAEQMETYDLAPDSFFFTDGPLDFTLVRVRPKFVRPTPVSPFPSLFSNGSEAQGYGYNYGYGEFTPNPDGPVPPLPWQPPLPVGVPRLAPIWPPIHRQPIVIPPRFAGHIWGFVPLPSTAVYPNGLHLNIIQHPQARRKEIAVQQNTINHLFPDFVHYITDTEPGSSGSPVFNNDWDLVALHHAAGERQNGVWIDNEGIRIDRIVGHLRDNLDGINPGVLNELGIA